MKKIFCSPKLHKTIFGTSITSKIKMGMLVISISILVAFMSISISYSYQNMLTESIDSAYKNLVFSKNNLDNMLNMIMNYSVILLSDEKIQDVLTQKEQPTATELSRIDITMRNRINAIVGSYATINAVLIYDNWGNIYESGITLLNTDSLPSTLPEKLPSWITTHPASYYIAVPGKTIQPDVMSFVRTISDYKTGRHVGFLEICIDESYVSKTYSASTADEGSMYIISSDNYIISHPDTKKLYTQTDLPFQSFDESKNYLVVNNKFIIYEKYDQFNSYLVSEIPKSIIQKKINKMIRIMLLAGISLITLCIAISTLISTTLTKNLYMLIAAIKEVNNGNWNVKVNTTSQDEVGILAQNFNHMLGKLQQGTKNLVQEQKLKREFQLELLNQQINPHFLYNTLDTICALAELNHLDELLSMVDNLTHFYRGVLSKGSTVISLKEELQIAVSYLNIMQTRYNKSFHYDLNIPESIYNNTALRLTLQPILENSIYHGFQLHKPGGRIQISTRIFSTFILIIVTDNGIGMNSDTLNTICSKQDNNGTKMGFGIMNVHERIRLYYGEQYGMKIYSKEGTGTRIILKIPKCHWRVNENV
ncbi:MAG: histidine kinase [Anaerocolumna sp.]